MSADVLLSILEGVKRTGPGRWMARCPAHGDKSPSLSIRELDDGRVQELRQDGNEIETLRYSLPSDIGRPHSIAVYVLRKGARP